MWAVAYLLVQIRSPLRCRAGVAAGLVGFFAVEFKLIVVDVGGGLRRGGLLCFGLVGCCVVSCVDVVLHGSLSLGRGRLFAAAGRHGSHLRLASCA